MTDSIVVDCRATFMADWSCYVDDVLHQDPEIAMQQGYDGAIMPEGALSVLAVRPELIDLDLLHAGRLRRRWIGYAPAAEGARLTVTVEKDVGSVSTTFTATDGTLVAFEHLKEADPPDLTARAATRGFRTGPIDDTRIRALVWSVGCLTGDPGWSWGVEPRELVERSVGVLLPSIVAQRAATGAARWALRVSEMTCQPSGAEFVLGACIDALVTNSGSTRDICLLSDGAVLATASAVVVETPRPTDT